MLSECSGAVERNSAQCWWHWRSQPRSTRSEYAPCVGSSLDEVRRIVGTEPGPELVTAIDRLSVQQVDVLTDAILDRPRTQALPARPVTEIWPLIPLRASLFYDPARTAGPVDGYAPAGVDLSMALNPRFDGTGAFSDGIMRALLYSHGLVIEDPLSYAAEMYCNATRDNREVLRAAISSATASLSEISELIDADIVTPFYTGGEEINAANELGDDMLTALDDVSGAYSVDDAWAAFEGEFISGLSAPLQALWREIRAGNRSPDLAYVEQAVANGDPHVEIFIDIVQVLTPRSIVGNAIASASCTVAAIRMLGGSCDILCGSPLVARLLFLGTPDPVEQARIHEIARTTVPNVENMSPRDLVAIRAASGALATWRADLAAALDQAERLRKAGVDPKSIQVSVEEVLAEARARLHSEARRTRTWNSSNLVTLVAGGLSGGGGAAVGGTGASIAAGAAGGVLSAFVQARVGSHGVPSFLDRHYLAFAKAGSLGAP